MSVCISRHGEFSSHDLDDEHTCQLCGVLDEDALRADLRDLRALLAEGAAVAREQAAWADRFRAERDELRALRSVIVPTLDEVRARVVPLGGGLLLARAEFGSDAEYSDGHEIVDDLTRANLVTSIVDSWGSVKLGGDFANHKIVIDVDMPCELIPSSTPGHFHLLIDHAMPWQTYLAVLGALASAGIVETGYLSAAIERGHTAVRLPWVRKGDKPTEAEIKASFAALMPPATD